MSERFRISQAQLRDTFTELRRCGNGKRECQVLWLSPWAEPAMIMEIVHPRHEATAISFDVDNAWLHEFWRALTAREMGVRVQVHTHPGTAFHSHTDDRWPIVQTQGFLSLVLPRFAQGDVGLEGAFLTRIGTDGRWVEVAIADHLLVTP